jgi:type II secretion system protein J
MIRPQLQILRRSSLTTRRRAAGGRRDGFTLLELLLATAIAGVVLLAIQTTFFGALRLHNTTHARNDSDLLVQRALGIIRRDFAGLALPTDLIVGQLQTSTFSSSVGESFGDRVSPDLFTTSGKIDGWNPFSEIQKVSYWLSTASSGNGRDLIRAVTRNLLPVQEVPGEPQVLLQGVLEATVEFYDGNGWISEWDSEVLSAMPAAIKLRLTMASEQIHRPAGEPIEVIVPVMVMTSATARAAADSLLEEMLP